MKHRFALSFILLFVSISAAQPVSDPAFDPPYNTQTASGGGKIRWNGTVGVVFINGKAYQQFGIRPDIPFGKWGVGLDFTFRFDEEGNFKEDEWNNSTDYIEKIYYIRYGLPGDPFYGRVGALDDVTLGYGLIMKHYNNTIQYPEIKRVGAYSEGEAGRFGWQGVVNNLREADKPGVVGARVTFRTDLKGLTLGASAVHDGNAYLGISDTDDDGVPNRLDQYPDKNDFSELNSLLHQLEGFLSHEEIDSLIALGVIPDVFKEPLSYKGKSESVTMVGGDAGIPLYKRKNFSVWGYGQAARVLDYGWGFAFPGIRSVMGPLEIGIEFRHFEKQFIGEFFNYTYEIERVSLENDTLFVPKRHRLQNLGVADGYYADAMLTVANIGYFYGWYLDMRGKDYPAGKSLYAEVGITPPKVSRLQKVSGYFMQPNVKELFTEVTDGTIYGAKVYFYVAPNVNLVYDQRITRYNGEDHRTIRVETMITF